PAGNRRDIPLGHGAHPDRSVRRLRALCGRGGPDPGPRSGAGEKERMSDARRSPWRPIVEGSLAQGASDAVEAIARDLSDPERIRSVNHSLALGDAGLAVLFGYLAEAFPSSGYDEISGRYLDRAIEAVAARSVSASLYPGFTGVAWAIEHLSRRGDQSQPNADDDPNASIDDLLRPVLERTPWTGPFDLTGGLVGICVYLRERLPRPLAASCFGSAV